MIANSIIESIQNLRILYYLTIAWQRRSLQRHRPWFPPIPSEPLNAPEEFPDAPIEVAAPTPSRSESQSESSSAPVEVAATPTPPKPKRKRKSKSKSKSKSQSQPDCC